MASLGLLFACSGMDSTRLVGEEPSAAGPEISREVVREAAPARPTEAAPARPTEAADELGTAAGNPPVEGGLGPLALEPPARQGAEAVGSSTAPKASLPEVAAEPVVPATPDEPEALLGLSLGGSCFPLCVAPEHLDPSSPALDASGFAEEAGARCVVPTGLVGASGRASCGYEGTPTDLLPPALDASRRAQPPPGVASSGFFVDGRQLLDAYGEPFVIRGINVPHIWFDPPEPLDPGSPFRYDAYDALPSISAFGVNTVRIVWQTQGGTPHLLREIVAQVVALRMVPMVELHDLTGNRDGSELLRMADYYASEEIRSILLDFEPYLLVNIANEWSGRLQDYGPAIERLRAAGIHHTLVIDGNGYGQNINSLLQQGPALLALDPEHNLLFSVHMYESFAAPDAITLALTRAADLSLPLIVGEFGWTHGGRSIDYELIMSEAERLGVGYLAWSWKGNSGGDEALDLAIDWQGLELSQYGSVVMSTIAATSQRASIFFD